MNRAFKLGKGQLFEADEAQLSDMKRSFLGLARLGALVGLVAWRVKMKKLLITALVAAGLTAPAIGQHWNGRYDDNYRRVGYHCPSDRAKTAYARIRHEVRQRDIHWRRAAELRAAVDRTAAMERRFCARGMNRSQAARLDRQWDRIENRIAYEGRG
jgi:hypothetical protein